MNSRPLLDYLAYPDDVANPPPAEQLMPEPPVDTLEARLKDLEARLRANQPAAPAPAQDLTLSAQIESILRRKAARQPAAPRPEISRPMALTRAMVQPDPVEPAPRPARVVIDPPPSVPVSNDLPAADQDFLRFAEAVYLIGQAARRFIDEPRTEAQYEAQIAPQIEPQVPAHPQPEPREIAAAPSTGDIDALSAVLRETVSAFRSVADDLAVSAGEIRNYATRPERMAQSQQEPTPEYQTGRRRSQPARHRDEDEILELRETIADLQDRLDDLLQTRRRVRY